MSMIDTILGEKLSQTSAFLESGTRIPLTKVRIADMPVLMHKTQEKHGYWAVQVGFGNKKKTNKPTTGHIRGAKLKKAPLFVRELRFKNAPDTLPEVGINISVTEVLKPGDIVDVIGISKGKGYAGVVKRHHFRGGPRTHGQSDRERAPGSIGQTTTPGRVYKGKRMAGRMGHKRVTVKNLLVVDIDEGVVSIKGLVPGPVKNLLMIKKVGEQKKFVPLYKKEVKREEENADNKS